MRFFKRGLDDPVACEVGAGDEMIEVLAVGKVAGRGENGRGVDTARARQKADGAETESASVAA